MMASESISKDDLFRAVLAMDVYHRGYNGGLALAETGQIGGATIGRSSFDESLIGLGGTGTNQESIGFYALEYTLNGQQIIAYRGTRKH